ncbi:MAG TPA: hypothetical protein VGI70_09860 [Polyangiales bacterium]
MHEFDAPRRGFLEISPLLTPRHRFAFSGVAFELLIEHSARWQLPPAFLEHASDVRESRVLAEVICSVNRDRARAELEERDEGALTFHCEGAHIRLLSSAVHAEISEVGVDKYAATACIAPNGRGASALALGLSAAILQRRGGLCLDATAIELDDRAVLFLGPNEASPLSAASLAAAPLFSCDRVSVAPDREGRYWAFSLPGADAVRAACRSQRRALPLAALLRVRPAPAIAAASLQRMTGSERAFALRAAADSGQLGPRAEHDLQCAIDRLCVAVPIFELHGVFDAPIVPLLRGRLGGDDHAQR